MKKEPYVKDYYDDEEKDLMNRALQENSVIIAQMTTLYDKGEQRQ